MCSCGCDRCCGWVVFVCVDVGGCGWLVVVCVVVGVIVGVGGWAGVCGCTCMYMCCEEKNNSFLASQ